MSPFRRNAIRIGVAAFLLSLVFSFRAYWQEATMPAPPAPSADAIVVLTGGADRVKAGLGLLADGRAPRLFISGAHGDVELNDLTAQEPRLTSDLEPAIALGRAQDTVGNARETAVWARENDVRTVLLVTGYYHMPRSLLLFARVLPGASIYPVPVEPPAATPDNWWRSTRGLSLILGEWLKYLATLLGAVG